MQAVWSRRVTYQKRQDIDMTLEFTSEQDFDICMEIWNENILLKKPLFLQCRKNTLSFQKNTLVLKLLFLKKRRTINLKFSGESFRPCWAFCLFSFLFMMGMVMESFNWEEMKKI